MNEETQGNANTGGGTAVQDESAVQDERAAVLDERAERAALRRERKEARRLAKKKAKATRPKIRKWRGILAGESRRRRLAVFAVIVVLMASLTFTQLGFLGVGLQGDYVAYSVTLLAPVALAALLFGMPLGTLSGLLAGAILFLHAQVQPLDYFEVNFISVFSSVILFTLVGFLTSFLFAITLRGNPPWRRRIIYIFIVCVVVSCFFSLVFMAYALARLTFTYIIFVAESGVEFDDSETLNHVFTMLLQMGNIDLQIWIDAALMIGICCLAFVAVARLQAGQGQRSLYVTFRGWLLGVVTLTFMVTTAASFIVITEQAKYEAKKSMDEEVSYLFNQLQAYEARLDSVAKHVEREMAKGDAMTEEEIDGLKTLISIDNLLDGYSKDADGSIVIFSEDRVILSDDPTYRKGESWDEAFNDVTLAVEKAVMTGNMIQMVYSQNASETATAPAGRDEGQSEGEGQRQDEEGQGQDEGQGDGEGQDQSQAQAEGEDQQDQSPGEGQQAQDSSANLDELFSQRVSTQMAFARLGAWEDYTVVVIYPDTMVFAERTSVMAWTSLSALALLLVVFLVASRLLGQVVVRRIDETNGVLAEITNGNLDARVDIRDSTEFKSLSAGINTTVGALKDWIAEAESRMDQELATAKAIQASALPRTFPPFPDIHRLDIYASMNPAREVGGDFYDFFLIGDDSGPREGKLGFVVADVSGKGVPAALFMMAAKTQVRNYLKLGMDPGEAIENANRQLCDGNDAGMFVTLFAGVLDYGTGHVRYVNAGHNPALFWQEGSWRWLKDISGIPLGLFDGLPYDTFELDMQVGDQFLVYTDGVTEAMNVEGELFGEDRLFAFAESVFTLHPRPLVSAVRYEVANHARGAEQSDDITLLALEYGVPPELTATLTVKASVSELQRVNDFIHTELDRRLCPVKVQNQLDIALEELFVNVAHYAYPEATPDNPGRVRVSYTYTADPPSVCVELIDEGIPYNPLEKPDAVTPDDIMDVPIGGLGILMAKQSVDEMSYEYRDGSNVVSFIKKW